MLSFRFDLTSAQLDLLMSIYGGLHHPSVAMADHRKPPIIDTPHFIPIVQRLIAKGLVIHVSRHDGERSIGIGYVVTARGREIAKLVIEQSQRILSIAQVAKDRGIADEDGQAYA